MKNDYRTDCNENIRIKALEKVRKIPGFDQRTKGNEGYQSVGKNIARIGAIEKLKGDPVFCADLNIKNSLVLKVLRSTKTHAEIVNIDTSHAQKIKGVVRVFTAQDIPGRNLIGIINKDQPLLAADKVRSIADAVALIAAETDEAAENALKAIDVTYNELPSVFDMEEALLPDAPKIHENGNVLLNRKVVKGNAEAAFANCDCVIEKEYRTSPIEHTFLEPDAGAGYVDADETLVIHASTQNPHYDHSELISLLNLEADQVRVIQAVTGGGFGSKLDLNISGFIALALYHLKRPVRCVYSREESFLATSKRHPFIIRMKTGSDKNGKLKAMLVRSICNTGAYGSYGIAVASRASVHATGPYEIEHVDAETACVYTNDVFYGAMRGFGVPQMAFAHESQIDCHAQKLNIDPLKIRHINALIPGSMTGTQQTLTASVGYRDCLDAIEPYYQKAKDVWLKEEISPLIRRGIGIGGMWYGIGNTGVNNPSTARVEMSNTGVVTLFTGCAEIGQGSTTILAQIAAEVLCIDPRSIRVVVGDTKYTTNAGATSASRQTYISGNAVKIAAENLIKILKKEAAELLETSIVSLIADNGAIIVIDNNNIRIEYSQLAGAIIQKQGTLVADGVFDPETVPLDSETGKGAPYATYAFAAHLVRLEVDVMTGQVTVEKVVAAHDVGKAIHPENVIGQINGGVAMGVGFALMEEFDPGKTDSMIDYHIPTCADVPEIIPLIIESQEPSGPFGAKGVGEPALIPTAPAIVNAITQALQKRIYVLPANLERVLEASIKSGHFGIREVENV
jgi:CO/xanthine dehydrogenase Mo-binding subunit